MSPIGATPTTVPAGTRRRPPLPLLLPNGILALDAGWLLLADAADIPTWADYSEGQNNAVKNGTPAPEFDESEDGGLAAIFVATAGLWMDVDGITVDLPVNGHITERVALLGEIANKALG